MNLLSEYKQQFLNYLDQNQFKMLPKGLYEPVNYIMNLGGKRMRPILVLMGCEMFDGNKEDALPAAFSVELFHNFSLLHDDIMDEAPLRRGQPAVHIKYDESTAILSGDVMMNWAIEFMMKCPEDKQLKLINVFNKGAIEVCEGQMSDMSFEKMTTVNVDQYMQMIAQKTGALLGISIQLGAIIGGANDREAEYLREFGRNIGIAFQIQDDILDTFGDPGKFGKKVGGDIAQNKKTLLLIKAQELANAQQKSELNSWLEKNDPKQESQKIEAVTKLYEAIKVREFAEGLKSDYLEAAYQNLEKVNLENIKKQPISDFAKFLMTREN